MTQTKIYVDEFYAECDRLGILVIQDFLMACGEYPEDEEWLIEALKKEATAAALGIEPVVTRLDPNRCFFPSLPYGGDHCCSATRGTTHNTYYLEPVFQSENCFPLKKGEVKTVRKIGKL